jgi:NADH-quinone oxidoreductase subunit N
MYGLATLGAFGVLIAIGEVAIPESADRGVDATRLEDLRGLGRRHPWLAAAMALRIFITRQEDTNLANLPRR